MLTSPLLPPREVPVGARVFAVYPGESEPAVDEGGVRLPALLRMTSGHRNRRVFVVESSVQMHTGDDGQVDAIQVQTLDAEDWEPGSRFALAEFFSLEEAPCNTRLAMILNDHCVTYADFEPNEIDYYINIIKDLDGTFYFCEPMCPRFYGCQIALPEGCVFTPVGKIGEAKPLTQRNAACMYLLWETSRFWESARVTA